VNFSRSLNVAFFNFSFFQLSTIFQVLSPISDKSQEQSSEQGDSAKTPKISPTDHILACCGANVTTEDENNGDGNTSYTKLNQVSVL
jgi:hypothetical protein